MKTRLASLLSLCLLWTSACSKPSVDLKEFVDRRINESWMKPGQYVEAATFFADGGHYYNHPDDPEATPLDEPHIIPLLTQLREEFGLEQYVILGEEANMAYAVVIKLPQDADVRRALETRLNEADAEFPGMILQEWGDEWLSLDFADEVQADVIREAWEED